MSTHRNRSLVVVFFSLGFSAVSALAQAAGLPAVSSANLSAHFDASDINGDSGATDPGNNNDVDSWKELVGGTSLIHNFPTDGKPTFLTSGIGGQKTVRFVSDGNGSDAGVGDLQADDLLYDNPANFNAQTVFVVATMDSSGGNYSAVVTNAFAGLNIRKGDVGPSYYTGNAGDFVTQGVNGTFNINGNPRLDIPGGYGAAHVVKAVNNAVQNYNGVRISDNVAPDRRWDGDVAEIITYDGVLNGNDTARVNKYLIDKYAINQVVDERLTNTSQLADASIAGFGGGLHVGVNFQYGAPVGTSFKGINFDNIDLSAGVPVGPTTLVANPGTSNTKLTMSIANYASDPSGRFLATSVAGTDNATINAVLSDMFYVGNGAGTHGSAALNFSDLPANTSIFVQVL